MKFFVFASLVFVILSCGKKGGDTIAPVTDAVRSKNGHFLVQLDWVTGPFADEFSNARLMFYDSDSKPLNEVEKVAFVPFMPSHGHGSAMDDQVIIKLPDNEYRVNRIFFTMGGPWVITVSGDVKGQTDSAQVRVNVP